MAIEAPSQSAAGDCPECLAGDLTWLLSQAHFALARELTAALEPLGITMRGYQVLATAERGSYTQKELADLVGLDKTTMVVTIDELEEGGLAERRPSSTDRRARVIGVTAAGKRKVTQGRKLVQRVQAEVLGTLPVAERSAFLDALGNLVTHRLSEPVDCKRPLRRRTPR
jgi:DNA-binding MarR family transcriptional regulator